MSDRRGSGRVTQNTQSARLPTEQRSKGTPQLPRLGYLILGVLLLLNAAERRYLLRTFSVVASSSSQRVECGSVTTLAVSVRLWSMFDMGHPQ